MDREQRLEVLADSLGEVARRKRRSLLVVCAATLLATFLSPSPIAIDLPWVSFSEVHGKALLTLLLFGVAYNLISFFIYGAADYIVWCSKYRKQLEREAWEAEERAYSRGDDQADFEEQQAKHVISHLPSMNAINSAVKPVAAARIILDFLFPLILSAYTLASTAIEILKN